MIFNVARSKLVFVLLVSISVPCRCFLAVFNCDQNSFGSFSLSLSRTDEVDLSFPQAGTTNRRDYLKNGLNLLLVGAATIPTREAAAASSANDISVLRQDVQEALQKLNDVPTMIQAEQWDAVRNLLVTPPFSVFRKAGAPWWQDYATAVEANGGDEFEVLELKEELQGHLQSLDMAVYNNVFNPIKTQGQTGATKQLVQSYYEDPTREYKATKAALEALSRIGG